MNQFTGIGRLTSDPELKYTQSGTAFAKFTLAINRVPKKEETDFINCTAWGKTAEVVGEWVRKGHRLAVMGQLKIDTIGDKEDRKTYAGINVQSVEFLESNKNENAPSNSTMKLVTEKEEDDSDSSDSFPF